MGIWSNACDRPATNSGRKNIDLSKEKGKLEHNKEISSWSWTTDVQVHFKYNTAVIVNCNEVVDIFISDQGASTFLRPVSDQIWLC